ncbi:protein argonaute-3-like isoform X2 [Adelges cooleyi]|nr:protein argonaute-3-like isoform X2 [Adelges cooleyi]XP_050438586.1 protein argonaute-3-like isoform X2 [Adelges cooleyi]XP_050438587.1 protein argonaute-3-like isoform X2 [Adelges cooleyi]XP_050438588.1 protein argonaute-3-like isoform X2 [Adelges cooleyi]
MVTITRGKNNKTIDFNIQTKHVKTIFMNKVKEYLLNGSSINPPQEAYQALNIVLKNQPFSLKFIMGEYFFSVPRNIPFVVEERREMWNTYFQYPTIGWKPYQNFQDYVNSSTKINHPKLTDYIYYNLQCNLNSQMDDSKLISLESYVKGLKIDFQLPDQIHSRRRYKVHKLFESANKFLFEIDEEGKKQTYNIVQYFEKIHKYTVKYPNLPCVHVGSLGKKTALPIELCTVRGRQSHLIKSSKNKSSDTESQGQRPPTDCFTNIESFRTGVNNQNTILNEFGIKITRNIATVPARVLDQPSLSYHGHKEVKPHKGKWTAERFFEGVTLRKWIVLNLDKDIHTEKIYEFEKRLRGSGQSVNVDISPMAPPFNIPIKQKSHINKIERKVTNFFNKQKHIMELIVVIIPEFPAGVYATVKQSSEIQVGVLTQCIKSKTLSYKMGPDTARNILLKINSKLNGINHTLALQSSPSIIQDAIIFGADVSFSPIDEASPILPSIAAVAASHDINGFQYNMQWRLQFPDIEIIQDLENIVHDQLFKFIKSTGIIPKKIFFFRDGASVCQFRQLLEYELTAIRKACLRHNPKYTPAITIIIVRKQNYTKMYSNNEEFNGKNGAVPPGTIVNTHITHPTELDFYLCSHVSYGTSKPTKYHVLWDDNCLTENQLEQLTYFLCFMLARCTRSVSSPAPLCYAHLAAFRARTYIKNKTIDFNHLDEEQRKKIFNSAFCVSKPMYFI